MSKTGFEDLLLTGKLPSPAGVGMKILEMTRSDDYSIDEMGNTIRVDSALTGRILKLANSAANAGTRSATTVSEAIMRLGSRSVRDLALAFSLLSERRNTGCKSFDFDHYWAKALGRAVCAQALGSIAQAAAAPTVSPQEAYICGLLGEIGRLALASVYPEQYAEVLGSGAMEDADRLAKLETERFEIDHRQLAAALLGEWGLPESLALAVRDYTRPPQGGVPPALTNLTTILRHAETMASLFVATPGSSRHSWERHTHALNGLAQVLEFDEPQFEKFFDSCLCEWVSWGEEMSIPVLKDVRYRKVRELAHSSLNGAAESSQPLRTPTRALDETGQVGSFEPNKDPIHILAVDDEPVQRKLLTKYLSQEGYRITLACDGKDALRLALELNPDIVLADYMMPEMDGLEVCRLLRRTEAGSRMYFVILTGRTEPEVLIQAFDAGVDDFATKPFAPRLLCARIKGGVRLVEMQRRIEANNVTMQRQMAELGVLTRKLRNAAMTDPLTGLPNRRYAMRHLDAEWAFTKRTSRPLTLIMVDIDHFKLVNDKHGHDVGDVVLVETAKVLQSCLRETDEVCRLGGEEFLVICRNTPQEDGKIVAERLRKAVEAHVVNGHGFDRNVTISLGICGWRPDVESVTALLKLADEGVYEAKHRGRNCVSFPPEMVEQKKSA